MNANRSFLAALALSFVGGSVAFAEQTTAEKWSLKPGKVELLSIGQLAAGPDDVLFIADPKQATVFAIVPPDTSPETRRKRSADIPSRYVIDRLNEKVATALKASPADIKIVDMIVSPESSEIFLAVTVQSGDKQLPHLVRVNHDGSLGDVSLADIPMQKAVLPNPPEDKIVGEGRRQGNRRLDSITDIAYYNGKLIVTGLSASESPSMVRELVFPFAESDQGTSVEIYHAHHDKVENAVIRAFVPMTIQGEPVLLAGFTCTPLVRFDLKELKGGEQKVRGTTVAELGNRNTPLDVVAYEKDGKAFLLMSNTARGVMKIATDDIGRDEGLTSAVSDTAGQAFEKVADAGGVALENVVQLDRLGDNSAIVITRDAAGVENLRTIPLP